MTILENIRYEKFALGVAAGKRPSQAYAEAGFARKPGLESMATWKLLKKPEVKARIAELQREAAAGCRFDCQQLLGFLTAVMLTPAGHVTEDHPLCQSFFHTRRTQTMRMPDKLRAADLVARIKGWNEPETPYPQDRVIRIGGNQS